MGSDIPQAGSMRPSLVLTVDTEPDNQWSMPAPGRPVPPLELRNTRGLARLLDFLRARGMKATWLTSWSVARDELSARLLREGRDAGDEIGAHLHPWETPPYAEFDDRAHPYLYEYETAIQREKLAALCVALREAFGGSPVSYRAGRWGIDETGLSLLGEAGFRIDTSVVPGHDFSGARGLSRGGPDFRAKLDGGPQRPWRTGGLWEVPASTRHLGALGGGSVGARLALMAHQATGLAGRAGRRALFGAGLCRLVWLRPLAHPARDLAATARALVADGAPILNVMFHSSETFQGTSPRTGGPEEVDRFYGDLDAIADAVLRDGRAVPETLSAAVARFEREGATARDDVR